MKPFDIHKAKVAVLMGGHSAERDISLMSGQGVLKALQSLSVNAHAFDPASQSLHLLRDQGFSHAFICLHGRHGEDGTVQADKGMAETLISQQMQRLTGRIKRMGIHAQ